MVYSNRNRVKSPLLTVRKAFFIKTWADNLTIAGKKVAV
jgi:hypothetical protein